MSKYLSMSKKSYKIRLTKEFFVAEKTNDVFMEVEFTYDKKVWKGLLPKFLQKQGLDLTEEEFYELMNENYELLDPSKKADWIKNSDKTWANKNTETYKVLNALYSGEWECRVCGPVPNVNPQPASRLRDLKKKGYIIGSKRKVCSTCNKKTMHDILVMLPSIETRFEHGNELRAPMSEKFKARAKRVLGMTEVCFNVRRTSVELLIDHKFPSQRWNEPESPNPADMPVDEIKRKFQLLSNQTNMWKSRYCDRCVKEGRRGDFMGIEWYYQGNHKWEGKNEHDENGCIGCPWYDLVEWKNKLKEELEK